MSPSMRFAFLWGCSVALCGCGEAGILNSEKPASKAVAADDAGAAAPATQGRIPPQLLSYTSIDVSVDRAELAASFQRTIEEYKPAFAAVERPISFSGVAPRRSDCRDPSVLKISFVFDRQGGPIRAQCVGTFYHEQPLSVSVEPEAQLRQYLTANADFWREYQRNPSIISTM